MLTWAILAIENESDREFVERLYTQNYAVMLQKAKGILKNSQRAEDAVEAVMLKLIDRIDLLHNCNQTSLRSYLLTCVRNEAVGQLRKDGKLFPGDAEEKLRALPDNSIAVDVKLLYRERVQSLVKALQSLPERESLALRMKYYENMSDVEIGTILGIKASAVRSLIGRARRKVFDVLAEQLNAIYAH